MRYKYVITRYSTPVIVTDTKEAAVEIAKAVFCWDDEAAEEYIHKVLYIPRDNAVEE